MDAGDRAGPHVIGQVAEHHTIRQSCSQISGEGHLQPSFNVLEGRTGTHTHTHTGVSDISLQWSLNVWDHQHQ